MPPPLGEAAPTKPALLRDDPLLQQKITLEATDRPLGDVLTQLSSQLKVDLTASSQVADQRVTLHLTDQPVYLLMNRLIILLSHLPDHPHGYYWEKMDRPVTQRPTFNLWRDLRSVQDEEYAQDYPRREAAVILRDMRNLCRLTPAQRENYKGDFPFNRFPGISPTEDGPEGRAMRDLTDEQLDSLLAGEKIPLDPALFPKEIAAFQQKQRADHERIYAHVVSRGFAAPALLPVTPAISVRRADRDGEFPDWANQYEVRLEGIDAAGVSFDVYDTNKTPDPGRLKRLMPSPGRPKPSPGPTIDLTPLLADPQVTDAQRDDLGFNLQALSKTAHINIYQEAFLSKPAPSYVSPLFWAGRPKTLTGTLPDLIEVICQSWNCRVQKVGDDYVFWSRTWAQDRATDVPERLIRKWQAKLKKQGTLTVEDNAEIAASLTWPQVSLTLNPIMPEIGTWKSVRMYLTLRLLGLLSSSEWEVAFSTNGLPLADLSPWVQQSFTADFRRDLTHVTGDQLSRAVLTFRTEQAGTPSAPTGVVIMNLSADAQPLFGTRATMPLPSPVILPTDMKPTALK